MGVENKELRILGPMKEEEQKDGEYHIMKLFIICTLHKILLR
jgi:hypothetical protein